MLLSSTFRKLVSTENMNLKKTFDELVTSIETIKLVYTAKLSATTMSDTSKKILNKVKKLIAFL